MRILKTLLFFLTLYTLHIIYVLQFSKEISPTFITKTYLFLVILYGGVLGLKKLFKILQFKSPYLMLSLNLLKILAAVIYLLPLLKSKAAITTSSIVHFFIAYFIFLTIEIIENKKKLKISK